MGVCNSEKKKDIIKSKLKKSRNRDSDIITSNNTNLYNSYQSKDFEDKSKNIKESQNNINESNINNDNNNFNQKKPLKVSNFNEKKNDNNNDYANQLQNTNKTGNLISTKLTNKNVLDQTNNSKIIKSENNNDYDKCLNEIKNNKERINKSIKSSSNLYQSKNHQKKENNIKENNGASNLSNSKKSQIKINNNDEEDFTNNNNFIRNNSKKQKNSKNLFQDSQNINSNHKSNNKYKEENNVYVDNNRKINNEINNISNSYISNNMINNEINGSKMSFSDKHLNKKIFTQNSLNEIENLEKNNIINNYDNLNTNKKYYITCPNCKNCIPHMETFEYDSNNKDFKIIYICSCSSKNNLRYAYFSSLITEDKPKNLCKKHSSNELLYFCEICRTQICEICKEENHINHDINDIFNNEIIKRILRIANVKKDEFNGYKILEKIFNEDNKQNYFKGSIQLPKDNEVSNNHINKTNKEIYVYESDFFNSISFEPDKKKQNEDNPKISNSSKSPNQSQIENISNDYSINKTAIISINQNDKIKNNINSKNLDKENRIKDFKNFYKTKTLNGHTSKIISLIQLESGRLATGSYDCTINIWDLEQNQCIKIGNEISYIFCLLEFKPNMILAGTNESNIGLWDINNNSQKFNFLKHNSRVNCLVTLDNEHFASGSDDSNIFIWNYKKRKYIFGLQGHKDKILTMIKLNDGRLCSGSADSIIKVWNWKQKFCQIELRHQNCVKCLYQLKDGTLLSGSDDSTINIWKDFENIKILEDYTHSNRSFCQIDDNHFISSSDNIIKIWDLRDLNNFQILEESKSEIICIIKLKNNKLASCYANGTIKIWY